MQATLSVSCKLGFWKTAFRVALVMPLLPGIAFSQGGTAEFSAKVLKGLRARFVGGAVLANSGQRLNIPVTAQQARGEQFTKANIYLAFESEPDILYKHGKESHWYFDPLLNVRLTTIGVTSGVSSEVVQLQGNTISGFLQSQKAAVIQGGVFFSRSFRSFNDTNDKFHWRFGPVVKGGYQSVTDSQKGIRIWDPDDDLFDFFSGGLRLSLMSKAKSGTKTSGPRRWKTSAYFEGGIGSFENFEQAIPIGSAARKCLESLEEFNNCVAMPPSQNEFTTSERKRVYLEGRLYLHYLHLGFELNNGQGIDDFRFFAGISVDIEKLARGQ